MNMRKFYLLTLLAFLPLLANADAVEIDGIYYNLNAEDQTAEVTVKPGNTSFGSNYSGVIEIPATVTYNEVLYSVTSIGVIAFQNCSVTSVTIPNSVTSIGPNAFDQSYKLTSVTIGSGVTSIGEYAFNACIGLTSILIPKSVITIGERAFYRCTALTSIVVESGNPNYDSRNNCNALIETATNSLIEGCNNTVIPDGIVTICGGAFVQCEGLTSMIIPNSVTTIGNYAFEDCYNMTSLTLGNGLETIGDAAFIYCNSLNSITIPASVSSIGRSILGRCPGLEKIQVENGNAKYDSRNNCNAIIETASNTLLMGCNHTVIPNSITSIGPGAFSGCTGLTSVTIASGVTSIGEGAFGGCTGLTSIVVEDGNTVYDSRNNCNALIETATGLLVAGCNNSVIPDGVKVIGSRAFSGRKDLTSILIPNSVTTIGPNAFSGCGLTSVTIPNSVTSIGDGAFFSGCELTSVIIGNSVSTIGRNAFQECYKLTSITFPNSVTFIGQLSFNGCSLSSIALGSGITSIESLAFLNVPLKDVYCSAKEVPEVSSSAFGFSSSINATLHVPEGSVDAYKAAMPWSGFKEVVAIDTKKVINVETAGTLSTLIPETEKYLIEELTLTGNLNGDDLALLRDMAGSDYNGFPTDGKLSFLDMSGATIVAGGKYVELVDENIYYNREIGNFHGGFDKDPQVSEANTLGKNVFAGCSKLETMIMPTGVVTVGERAFSDTSLKDIVWPTSLATIGYEAFFGCKFTSFTLPASVESVGGNILKYCSTLELSVESGNSNYDSRDNCNAIIETSTNTLIGGCKNTIIPNSVTSIGVEAFCGCASGLLSLTIPSSVTSIGYDAFEACSDLVHVYCNAEVVPTTDADAFKNVDIRNRVTLHVPAGSVEAYQAAAPWNGFNKVVALSTNIPDVEIQGIYYNLNEETLTAEVTKNPDGSYSGDLLVGSGIWYDSRLYSVTSIGNDAFAFSNLLTSVVIPNSVTSIGSYAFYFCEDLSSIMIPNSVTKIFGNPFQGCSSLESISVEDGNSTYDSRNNCNAIIETGSNTLISGCKNTLIPASVTSIGDNAFTEIANLTSISIPASVEYIGSASFSSCSNLESIQVESGNTKYDSRNNCNAIIETASNTLIHGCKNTVIPANVTSIGEMAFDECDGLTSVTIPSAVTFIGISAFEECKDLVSMQVESGNTVYDSRNNCNAIIETASNTLISGCKNTIIPISVTSIGENAFQYCFGLESVTIPCDVTSIGNMAFFNCYQLTDIYCSAENVPTTGYGAFDGINGNNVTLHVPAGSVEAYKAAAPWSGFNKVVALSTNIPDVEIQGVYYNLNEETLTAEVTKNPNGPYSGDLIVGGGIWYDSRLYSVTSIGKDAFALNGGITSVSIQEGVTTIGEGAFGYCPYLTSVTFPSSLISIGEAAFYGCERLTSVTIPASVTSISVNIFGSCNNLESIQVEAGNTKYDSRNNCNAIIDKVNNTLISGCKNTEIPKDVTSIGAWAFHGLSSLTSITIPNSVTSIGEWALGYCDGLTSLTIPASLVDLGTNDPFTACSSLESIVVEKGNPKFDSRNDCNAIIEKSTNSLLLGCKNTIIPNDVTSIGNRAFDSCRGLISLTIPASVTSIGYWAFINCTGLTDLYCLAAAVPTTNGDPNYPDPFVESNISNATLHVPAGSVDLYKAADCWKDFKSIVGDASIELSPFIGTDLWAGYVSEADFALPSGLTAYTITALGNNTATATSLDYIPKNVPILLKRSDSSVNSFNLIAGTGTAPTTNLLKVYNTDKILTNREGYVLFKDEFVLVNEGTLPAGRIFLPLNGGDAAMTRGIVIEGEGTTGVHSSMREVDDANDQWYDLQGRRLEGKPIKKGLYILNGRKVVVK